MTSARQILRFLRPYRRRIGLALLGTFALTILSVMPPLLLRVLVDGVIQPQLWHRLAPIVLVIVLLPAITAVVSFFNIRALIFASRRFVGDVRLAVYRKILALGRSFHADHSSGALVGRLMDDVNMMQKLITGQTTQIVVDLVVVVFAIGVAMTVSLGLTLLMVVMLALYVSSYRVFSHRIRFHSNRFRSINDSIAGRLAETIEGVRHTRIYNREALETGMFLNRLGQGLHQAHISNMGSAGLTAFCTAITGLGSAGIMGLGAYMVLTTPMTYGDLLAFGAYLWMTVNPAVRLTTVAGQLTETFVSVDRVLELLEAEIDVPANEDAPDIHATRGAVRFDHAWFGYSPSQPLYRDLQLDIAPGATVALVGPTGCGKTTLVSLLMRYWDPDSGRILIDDQDIRHVNLPSLRRRFGVVLQKPHLFNGTVLENIAYGQPSATRAEVEAAAKVAELGDMIAEMPQGLDTVIGTDGVQLSVGEKQRVSIARAILKDPLILIMDEATSALDSHSEALIQRALERVMANRTSLVVAHRLSTIVNADRIVVMDAGQIVETGRHEELLAKGGGMYRRLYTELLGSSREALDA